MIPALGLYGPAPFVLLVKERNLDSQLVQQRSSLTYALPPDRHTHSRRNANSQPPLPHPHLRTTPPPLLHPPRLPSPRPSDWRTPRHNPHDARKTQHALRPLRQYRILEPRPLPPKHHNPLAHAHRSRQHRRSPRHIAHTSRREDILTNATASAHANVRDR